MSEFKRARTATAPTASGPSVEEIVASILRDRDAKQQAEDRSVLNFAKVKMLPSALQKHVGSYLPFEELKKRWSPIVLNADEVARSLRAGAPVVQPILLQPKTAYSIKFPALHQAYLEAEEILTAPPNLQNRLIAAGRGLDRLSEVLKTRSFQDSPATLIDIINKKGYTNRITPEVKDAALSWMLTLISSQPPIKMDSFKSVESGSTSEELKTNALAVLEGMVDAGWINRSSLILPLFRITRIYATPSSSPNYVSFWRKLIASKPDLVTQEVQLAMLHYVAQNLCNQQSSMNSDEVLYSILKMLPIGGAAAPDSQEAKLMNFIDQSLLLYQRMNQLISAPPVGIFEEAKRNRELQELQRIIRAGYGRCLSLIDADDYKGKREDLDSLLMELILSAPRVEGYNRQSFVTDPTLRYTAPIVPGHNVQALADRLLNLEGYEGENVAMQAFVERLRLGDVAGLDYVQEAIDKRGEYGDME
jgi:hypothetical protein